MSKTPSTPITTANSFLKLSHKKKMKILYELDYIELASLWVLLEEYASINGINDDLQHDMDTINNLCYLRCKEEGVLF